MATVAPLSVTPLQDERQLQWGTAANSADFVMDLTGEVQGGYWFFGCISCQQYGAQYACIYLESVAHFGTDCFFQWMEGVQAFPQGQGSLG